MRRVFAFLLFAVLLCVLFVAPVLADSPHFISESASLNPSGSLTASFKESGLGSTLATEQVTLSANSLALYACINGGDNHPQAENKATVAGPLSATDSFPVRNGETTGSLTIGPVPAGDFMCPSGQQLTLIEVSYTDVLLTGLAGDTAAIPGTFGECLAPQYSLC